MENRNKLLEDGKREIDNRDQLIQQLQGDAVSTNQSILHLNQDIAARDQEIKNLNTQLTGEQNHLKRLFQQLSNSQQQLSDKYVSLNERQWKIKTAETHIANDIRKVDSLTKEVQYLRASEAHKNTELKRLNTGIDRQNAEVVVNKQSILDLQQTISTGSSDIEAVRLQKELDDKQAEHKRTVDSLNSSIRRGEALLEQDKARRKSDKEYREGKVEEM